TTAPAASPAAEDSSPASGAGVPAEALTGVERQPHFRLRRQRDPLGEGHPCTWRTLLIKVAAEVAVRTRRGPGRPSSRGAPLELAAAGLGSPRVRASLWFWDSSPSRSLGLTPLTNRWWLLPPWG